MSEPNSLQGKRRNRRHPVWDVYDEYRTAVYNLKAYSKKIHSLQRWNLFMDIVLAVFTPSSAITGLFLWDTPFGRPLWNFLISIAAVVAVAKPLLRLDEKIEQLFRSVSGYTFLYHDLERIKFMINQEGRYTPEMQEEFWDILRKKRVLARSTAFIHLSESERRTLFEEVNNEFPVKRFFVPGE